jgi:hypothetical protein
MGNFNSKQNINVVPENIPQEIVENIVVSDDDIFTKILDISNGLLMEYNNEFLDEKFCNKLALVYEKKLSNFDIKLLREINNTINSNIVNEELLLTLQYLPSENDTFFVELFKDKLEENFWSKSVEFNPTFLKSNNVNLKNNNIDELIREKKIDIPRYIDKSHVNNLLESYSESQKVPKNLKSSNENYKNNTVAKGGNPIVSNFNQSRAKVTNNNNDRGKRFLEERGISHENANANNSNRNGNNESFQTIRTNKEFETRSNNESFQTRGTNKEFETRSNNGNNESFQTRGTNKEFETRSNNGNNESFQTMRTNKEFETRSNNRNGNNEHFEEGLNNRRGNNEMFQTKENKRANKEVFENRSNNRRINNKGTETRKNRHTNNHETEVSSQQPYQKPKYNEKEQKLQYNSTIQKPYEKPRYNEEEQKSYQQKQYDSTANQQPREVSIKQLNNTANEVISTNLNIPVETSSNKAVNTFIKLYTVPRGYQKPEYFCENVEKCKLTKKQICQSISENFIVRNNIVAAILTTIPKKIEEEYEDSNGKKQTHTKYVGGICYQKFLNLDDCRVCVPYDYKDLKNKDINKVLKKILEKADYLTEEDCRQNAGYFFRLTEREILIFRNKLLKASKIEASKIEQKLKYNLLFIEFTKKLKDKYFSILNKLITILEKMQGIPILNNTTLNLIGTEVKNLIDEMYNSCHYYYVYAILSLINVDLTEEVIEEDKLEGIISKALK